MQDDFEGYKVESILENKTTKKRKSKNKGKRGELALVKLLNERFQTQDFSRVVGSGNRWSHVANVADHYIGDIVCPPNFKFVIECKFGYPDVDLYRALVDSDSQLDSFLQQASDDAERANRQPLLCWKKDHRQWLSFIKDDNDNDLNGNRFLYKGWVGCHLESILHLPDSFFFEN